MTQAQTNPTQTNSYAQQAKEIGEASHRAFRSIRNTSSDKRDASLITLSNKLQEEKNQRAIIQANAKDMEAAKTLGLSPDLIDRLSLDKKRIEEIAIATKEIVALPNPIGEVLQGKKLPNGIELIQKRVPLGVIFIIYESRPNVTIDVGALCLKSGNCAILRGGKEAFHTNFILFQLFQDAIKENELPEACLQFISQTDRNFMVNLLEQDSKIDLVIPRGGEALVHFVTSNTKIPVVKHDKGLCNLYIDASANIEKAIAIAINAKLQRTSVCNAIENLIIHKDFPQIKELLKKIHEAGARLLGCKQTKEAYSQVELIPEENISIEYSTEYLDARLSVKIVDDIKAAVDFIFQYNSGHSEAIVSQDTEKITYFQENIDSASIFINCSTRFHDGNQMGFGAEMGISTGRLHVRGPMSLRDLTTGSFFLRGNGQCR